MRASGRAGAFPGLASFEPVLSVMPAEQRRVWPWLAGLPLDAVLYGGSALALRLGHRRSLDFDLFVPRSFAPGDMGREARFPGDAQVVQSAPDTLVVRVEGVRVSIFGVHLPSVADPDVAADIGLPVASLRDLAATKVKTLLDRAEAKDYRDIDALLGAGLRLDGMLADARAVFGPGFNVLLALKAVTSFEEGDLASLPAAVRRRLVAAAREVREIPAVAARHPRILPAGLPAGPTPGESGS